MMKLLTINSESRHVRMWWNGGLIITLTAIHGGMYALKNDDCNDYNIPYTEEIKC